MIGVWLCSRQFDVVDGPHFCHEIDERHGARFDTLEEAQRALNALRAFCEDDAPYLTVDEYGVEPQVETPTTEHITRRLQAIGLSVPWRIDPWPSSQTYEGVASHVIRAMQSGHWKPTMLGLLEPMETQAITSFFRRQA
jgi:hypothetical protein